MVRRTAATFLIAVTISFMAVYLISRSAEPRRCAWGIASPDFACGATEGENR